MHLTRLEPGLRVGDQAFEAIQGAIMSGELAAGDRLQIRVVAAKLGTSVMPVREAIKRLEEVGLVESLPYRGSVVKEPTCSELQQVYAVRRLLESEAARLGASRPGSGTVERMRALRTTAARAIEDRRPVAYIDADEQLLLALYEGAGNPVLLETITTLWRRCRVYKITGVGQEILATPTELLWHQDQLVAAAVAHDGETAAEVTRRSMDAAIERIDGALSRRAQERP